MTERPHHPSVDRVSDALRELGHPNDVTWLAESARTAAEAAAALGVSAGQIASSIVFTTPNPRDAAVADAPYGGTLPVLVVTSGRHRVDTATVSALLQSPLGRADADFVRAWSGFAIGGVSPIGWHPDFNATGCVAISGSVTVLVDQALADYDTVWAAAGHPHSVFATTFADLVRITGGRPAVVGE